VRIAADLDTVVWTEFWGTSGRRSYPEIGPFRFARRGYEAALACRQRAASPVREHQDLSALSGVAKKSTAGPIS